MIGLITKGTANRKRQVCLKRGETRSARKYAIGYATFSVILSFNETVRTSLVQGPLNTVQTYIWSRYLQVGLSPETYALMSLLILITLVLIAGLLFFNLRKDKAERLHA